MLVPAVVDPERFVAEQDVAHYAETGRIDVGYLTELSADAVPVLTGLPEPVRSCALGPIAARTTPAGDWRSANLSRAQARDTLAGVVPCGRY